MSPAEQKRRSLLQSGLSAALDTLRDAEDDQDVILVTEFVFEIVADIKRKRSCEVLDQTLRA